MTKYYSTKTYNTDRGLSCCFRQWRADHSHCSLYHGYSLGFKFIFESPTLDDKQWGYDFGNMKPMKEWLDSMFDHTFLVAEDDPFRLEIEEFANKTKLMNVKVVPAVGCERIAQLVWVKMNELLEEMKKTGKHTRYPINPDVKIKSVEVFEHGANSAIYEGNSAKYGE